jgi:excisionase family DNA binding protein
MDDYIDTIEAAKLLGRTPRRILQFIADGTLPAITVGSGRRVVHIVKRADVKKIVLAPKGRPKKAAKK